MFDLALSKNGDLIFSAARDLQGVGGIALVEQRMKLRLRLQRGSWIMNPNLGSNLHTMMNVSPEQAEHHANLMVREALAGMDDISVYGVHTEIEGTEILIRVEYIMSEDDESLEFSTETRQLEVVLPLGG